MAYAHVGTTPTPKIIKIIAQSPLGLTPFIENKEKTIFKGRSSVTLKIFKTLQRVTELRPFGNCFVFFLFYKRCRGYASLKLP